MTKKIFLIAAIFLCYVQTALADDALCQAKREKIWKLLEKANYCTKDEECTEGFLVDEQCNYQFYLANIAEDKKLWKEGGAIKEYRNSCEKNICPPPTVPHILFCKKGRCHIKDRNK